MLDEKPSLTGFPLDKAVFLAAIRETFSRKGASGSTAARTSL
jgi:hypothetical protein